MRRDPRRGTGECAGFKWRLHDAAREFSGPSHGGFKRQVPACHSRLRGMTATKKSAARAALFMARQEAIVPRSMADPDFLQCEVVARFRIICIGEYQGLD